MSLKNAEIENKYTMYYPARKQGDDIEEKMRTQDEIVSMFEATKKQLDEIEEAPRTGDSLQEAKRLMLSSQLSILSWMLADTKNEKRTFGWKALELIPISDVDQLQHSC